MSTDPKYIEPPDDSGSDTYARYRYQAKIIFPFVLSCGMGHDIVSVIPVTKCSIESYVTKPFSPCYWNWFCHIIYDLSNVFFSVFYILNVNYAF